MYVVKMPVLCVLYVLVVGICCFLCTFWSLGKYVDGHIMYSSLKTVINTVMLMVVEKKAS